MHDRIDDGGIAGAEILSAPSRTAAHPTRSELTDLDGCTVRLATDSYA